MKDAVGSSLLLYVVIIVVGIIGISVVASNSYSKAYKAKNNITSAINNYYLLNVDTSSLNEDYKFQECFSNESCINKIIDALNNLAYRPKINKDVCSSKNILKKIEKAGETSSLIYPKASSDMKGFCIYKNIVNDREYYYSVVTFSYLNLNVLGIGTLYKNPVYGETRIFYDYAN